MLKDTDVVTITAGDIRRTADTCPTAKAILKVLAPNAFQATFPEEMRVGEVFWLSSFTYKGPYILAEIGHGQALICLKT